jgi:hypothetical protein
VGGNVRDGELVLLALRRHGLVWGERGDVDQPGHPVIGSCGGDDASAVGVADEDGRAADPPERAEWRGDCVSRLCCEDATWYPSA